MRIRKRLRLNFIVLLGMYLLMNLTASHVQAQVSGTFTINSNLPTGGSNFHTFTEAVISMANGISGPVVFNVAPGSGPYNEQLILDYHIRSSAARPVTFNCNGVTLTFVSTNSLFRAGIKMDSVDYVTWDSLTLIPAGMGDDQYGVGFHLVHDADHNTIRRCTIIGQTNLGLPQNNEGIVINGSDDFSSSMGASNCDSNLIAQNIISGANNGITISAVPFYGDPVLLVKGNQVINNVITDAFNAGIYMLYTDNTLIQGNDITGGVHAFQGTGIISYEGNQNLKILNNRIHHFFADPSYTVNTITGIDFGGTKIDGAYANVVANNLIYDFQSVSLQRGIVAEYGGSFLNIYHNTISLEDHSGIGAGSTYGIYTESYTNINVLNNVVTISRVTTGKNYAIYMSQAITTFSSNRNDLYVPSGSSVANAVGYLSNTQTTLANWQAKTGYDFHSVSIDPKYQDAAHFVLIPTDSSIDNMGQYAGINNDITGAIRNNTHPDIGAYEFLTPVCTTPVLGGTAATLPSTTVCEGDLVALNLGGNSFGTTQTYTWQTAATATGTYTNVSSALVHPAYDVTASVSLYYRAAVACGTTTVYSDPVLLNVNPSLPSGAYTINSAQPTAGTNFKSYTDALNAISCGIRGPVVFNVASGSGPYREQLIINRINGVSATNTVTFNGNGTTLVYLSANTNERAVIKLNGADYFVFDSLTIVPEATTSGQYGVGVQLLNDADHNTIRRCSINCSTTSTSTDLVGICISPVKNSYTNTSTASYCDSNTISGNTIIGGNYGITCTSAADYPSLSNVITNNTIKDQRAYGIYVAGSSKMLIEGNDISRPIRTNGSSLYAIYITGQHKRLSVSKNRVHNPYDGNLTSTNSIYCIFNDGTDATTADPIVVSNNLLYNLNGAGPQYGITNLGADSIWYYHNTISIEDSNSTSTQLARAFYQSTDAFGLVLKNNNIVIKRGGKGTKHCLYFNAANTTFTADHNNYYMASKLGSNYIGRVAGADYGTRDSWTTASSNDANSLSMDPVYKDPAHADLSSTLLAFDNKGEHVNIATDINNVQRSAAKPDIGAFEFTICTQLGTPPVAHADTVGTEMIRFSWTPVTNATGYLVSLNGAGYTTPSSGATGTTHMVTGLQPGTSYTLFVKALGVSDECPTAISEPLITYTLTNQYFVPNAFTPNGNTKNDVFRVYGSTISTLRLMIFNQWGQKLFETSNPKAGWDGTCNGKQQPVGVYIYVVNMVLNDGTTINKKGTINLIR